MSKKNNLAKRRNQHNFDLQREKEEKQKRMKKLEVNKSKMKVDGRERKRKRSSKGFQVGKNKLKTKMSALTKAKIAQAMEVDK